MHRPSSVRSVAVYEPVAFGVLRSAGEDEALASVLPGDEAAPWPDGPEALEAWLERFIDYWNGPGGWRALAEPVRETFRRAGPKIVGEVRSLGEDRTPHLAYTTLPMPVLLLGGASTLAADRVLSILERSIPRATRVRIEGAGHMGPLTHAREVNARIAAHLAAA
jgi:pimeloyl-ACP methyl ester carboxylesterase